MLDLQLSTIVFQIINFLILLVVLTRFLYQPVLRTMQQRQDAISARLREADERARQANAEREQLAQQRQQVSAETEQILARARTDAATERGRLTESARLDAARFQEEAQRAIQEQERAALASLEVRIRETAASVAGTLIRQAAGPAVHQSLVDRLLASGIPADRATTAALQRSLARPGAQLVVELAYPPDAVLQERLRELIATQEIEIAFRVDAELLAGARILAGQQVVVDISLQRTLLELQAGGNGVAVREVHT